VPASGGNKSSHTKKWFGCDIQALVPHFFLSGTASPSAGSTFGAVGFTSHLY